jgi:hypothetical protein
MYPKTFCFLPYVSLAPDEPLKVGRAMVYNDADDIYPSVLGCERPKLLQMFKSLPRHNIHAGNHAYGTFIVADDDSWLSDNVETIVSLLYYLGSNGTNYPAECFYYQTFDLYENPSSVGFTLLHTKKSRNMESAESLAIYPSFSTRGFSKNYKIDDGDPYNSEIIRLFTSNPSHRIIVAIRQFFQTQFADPFFSSLKQDISLYCGAIEAALGFDGRQKDSGNRFSAQMASFFEDSPLVKRFFYGMYVERSLYLHGSDQTLLQTSDTVIKDALHFFRLKSRYSDLLRNIVIELIRNSLSEVSDKLPQRRLMISNQLVVRVLHSDAIWSDINRILNAGKSADKILHGDDDIWREPHALSRKVLTEFAWPYCSQNITKRSVFCAIKTCLIIISRLSDSKGMVYETILELGDSITSNDEQAIARWANQDPLSILLYINKPDDKCGSIALILRAITFYYRNDQNDDDYES